MISPRQAEERELRKQRILNGALKVFQEKGIEHATMEEIASASGFGKASLYYYFSSKEDVFSAIMEAGWLPMLETVNNLSHTQGSPRKVFIMILGQIADISLRDPTLYRFLFSAPHILPSVAESTPKWKQYQIKMYETLQNLLNKGIEQGEFPQVAPTLMMKAVGGIFHGLLFLGRETNGISEKDIEKLFTDLLTPPPSK